MPAQDVVTNKYWIAGYRINNRCEGILDPMMAGLSDFAGREIYLIHFAAHPESMDGKNLLIIADFPCYLAQDRRAKPGEPSHAKG